MKTFETQIDIEAPPARIWQMLTQDMPRNPSRYGIAHIEGTIATGAKIKLRSEVAPNRAFALTVTRCDAPNDMVWRGGMPLGLFVGTRTFTIKGHETGSTFQMREVFSGPMAGLITRSMPDLTPSFTKFAMALKEEAERK